MLDCVHDHARHPRQHAVDDEARRVVDEDRRACAAFVADVRDGRERDVVRLGAARTTSTSGISATGLKKCIPTTRSGRRSSDAMSVTESDDVFVASTHSARTTSSSSANTCFFTVELLEDGLEHEVAVGEAVVGRAARDERGEEARLPSS